MNPTSKQEPISMTFSLSAALDFAHQNHSQFLTSLQEFLVIPSISTDPAHKPDILQAADWLANRLKALGMQNVQVMPTGGSPVVYAEYNQAGPAAPTILIYGHYDVQPVEPLELWKSGPFEPEVRADQLYARGSSDMKGQIVASLSAIQAAMQTGGLPVNLKFLYEGEEEIGSPHLSSFLKEHREQFACDLAFNPDAGMTAADLPTITYGLRGLAYFELRIYGPDHDLHSGQFGGVVHNPAQALCEIIAGMHDSSGRITLPGFYDQVRALAEPEKAELGSLSTGDSFYREQTGVSKLYGEPDYLAVERIGARPTLEVNGMIGGFTGIGAKTVIPAEAMAKISMRLVPDQTPEQIDVSLRAYLTSTVPPTVRWELDTYGGSPASITDRDSKGVNALSRALQAVWGKPPVFRREGGSIPVVLEIQQILGADSVLTGFSLPEDNIHAPNEKLHLPTWQRGIDAILYFFSYAQEGIK
jgi:acetylornithine deacetylase/succinyl-diaminopimelate desuccinylase-like protein